MDTSTLFEKFELIADAPDAITRMRELILHLAFRGNLVDRIETEGDGPTLKDQIGRVRESLIKTKAIKRQPVKPEESSKVPFELPPHWSWTKLGEIGDWGSGSTPSRGNPEYYGGELTWLKSGELNDDQKLQGSEEKVTDLALQKCSFRLNKPGDILLAMYGATIGKAAILAENAVTNQAVCGCTPFDGVSNRFLFLFLISQREYFRSTGEGGAQPNISKVKIVNYNFPLPPLAEQKRIVAKVDELMALCDQLEAQQQEREQQRAELNRAALARFSTQPTVSNLNYIFHKSYHIPPADLRKTILTLAVQGKLVPQDPNDEPAEENIERINSERESLLKKKLVKKPKTLRPLDSEKCLNEIPENWEWVRLGEIALDFRYGTSRKCDYDTGLTPVLRIPNLKNGRIDAEDLKFTKMPDSEFQDLKLNEGDLLLIRSNGSESLVGRSAVVGENDTGYAYAGYLVRAKLLSSQIYSQFVHLALETEEVRQQIERPIRTTSGVKNINTTELAHLTFPIPPIAEQRRIVAKVDQMMALVDQLEAQLEQSRSTATNLLTALVAELTTS